MVFFLCRLLLVQFGTNLRATAAISIPNFVRGFLPLIILLFKELRTSTGNFIMGGWITEVIVIRLQSSLPDLPVNHLAKT